MQDWPTVPVEMNHLELMGACMALQAERDSDGLSEPQVSALEKLQDALAPLLLQMLKK